MKILGIAVIVDALLWVLIFFASLFGYGHVQEAKSILGQISGFLFVIVFMAALGSTGGRNDDHDE